MRTPSIITKLRKLRFGIDAILISILIPLLAGYATSKLSPSFLLNTNTPIPEFQTFVKNKPSPGEQKTVDELTKEVNKLEGSLSMCLNDEAEMTDLEKRTYNSIDMGITTPLLDGLISSRTLFTYKRSEIEEDSFTLNKDQNPPTYLTVFILKKAEKLPDLDEKIAKENNVSTSSIDFDFPIFYSYEFAQFVQPQSYISARIPNDPPTSYVYTNKNGIKMYKGINGGPKCVYAATLRFQATTHQGKQIFVILSKERKDMFDPCIVEINSPEMRTLYGELEKIADTFEIS